MSNNFKDVQELHKKMFGLTPNIAYILPKEHVARADFIAEELFELRGALQNNNGLEVIDALVDIAYVAMGTAALMGINWQTHWDEVHRCNMEKVPGKQAARPDMPRDLAKPEDWEAPDHQKFAYKKPRIMVIGHARHGKDTVCELLRDKYNLNYVSSSRLLAGLIWQDEDFMGAYSNSKECWEDRINHRTKWFNKIVKLNTPTKTTITQIIYSHYDIYCGIRDASELWAVNEANLYDLCIWVDASGRLELENPNSINVTKYMADVVLYNNGTLEELERNLHLLMKDNGYEYLGH